MASRLTVNLTDKSDRALDDLTTLEGLNKTDVVNRAVQVYAFLVEQMMSGKEILLRDTGDSSLEKVHII